jgi:UPF0755 protein
MKLKRRKIIFIILFVSLIVPSFYAIKFFSFLTSVPIKDSKKEIIISVEKGSSFSNVAKNLEEEGLVLDKDMFIFFAKIRRVASKIKSGDFLLNYNMTPIEILDVLINTPLLYEFTIPEGYNIYQIAEVLFDKKLIKSKEKFLNLCKNKNFIKSLGLNTSSLEGYLYPNTYRVEKQTGAKGIIKEMYNAYRVIFTEEYKKRALKLGFTEYEIIILASIIEKETGVKHERKLISSVFHNRLRIGMRLQSDPTTIYGLMPGFDGKLRKKHLKQYNKYNTYSFYGLPKGGPIANPGKESIHAALYPDQTKFLYFVSRNDGTHKFSKTYKEHRRAVYNYQKRNRFK